MAGQHFPFGFAVNCSEIVVNCGFIAVDGEEREQGEVLSSDHENKGGTTP